MFKDQFLAPSLTLKPWPQWACRMLSAFVVKYCVLPEDSTIVPWSIIQQWPTFNPASEQKLQKQGQQSVSARHWAHHFLFAVFFQYRNPDCLRLQLITLALSNSTIILSLLCGFEETTRNLCLPYEKLVFFYNWMEWLAKLRFRVKTFMWLFMASVDWSALRSNRGRRSSEQTISGDNNYLCKPWRRCHPLFPHSLSC